MAQVLSLKELRTSSALKAEIKKLEDEKQELLEQMDRQKKLEQKLRDDILEQKKDFEHLEKQFDHFAGVEAECERLQQELAMERLEKMVDTDKKDNKLRNQVKKAREEMAQAQAELKELKKLDPQRLKRQVTDLKKKNQEQGKDNKNLNAALVTERKENRELAAEKEKLELQLEAVSKGTDIFWESEDGTWVLSETGLLLKGETEEEDAPNRVRALNRETGLSVVSKGLDDDDKAAWSADIEIPDEVTEEAGKRLKAIAAEAEEEAEA